MTTAAFLLVFGSAFCHASWNFLLKRSDHKTAFLWSLTAVAALVFLAPAIVAVAVDGLGTTGLLFGVVSGVLHGLYALSLARGYRLGDFSAVYPISRGMGPALIPLAAVIFLDERTSVAAGFGIALVVFGVYTINIEARGLGDLLQPLRALSRPATRVAFLTGGFIAAYSLWDKAALDHMSPLTLLEFAMVGNALVMAPVVFWNGGSAVRGEWAERRWSVLVAGVLSPLAYTLVLVALTTSRIAYVAPAREFGIVIGAVLGVWLLSEAYGGWRIAGAVLILAGVITLGVAP